MPIVSVKLSKLIPMVLLASILAISFSLVTNPNAFASQVWENSIAKFTYPDDWKIVITIGNGEGIYLQPINEPNVYVIKRVYQDSANGFSTIVESIKQDMMNIGFKIEEVKNEPGVYFFLKSGFNNGIHWVGGVEIKQILNTNDVVITEYTGELSKMQQYYAHGSEFDVSTYPSLQEQGVFQEQEVPQSSTSSEDPVSEFFRWARELLSDPAVQDWIEYCTENPNLCPSAPSSDQSSPGLVGIPNVFPGVRENTDIVPWYLDDSIVPP
jgi:hypothetical protein